MTMNFEKDDLLIYKFWVMTMNFEKGEPLNYDCKFCSEIVLYYIVGKYYAGEGYFFMSDRFPL